MLLELTALHNIEKWFNCILESEIELSANIGGILNFTSIEQSFNLGRILNQFYFVKRVEN